MLSHLLFHVGLGVGDGLGLNETGRTDHVEFNKIMSRCLWFLLSPQEALHVFKTFHAVGF